MRPDRPGGCVRVESPHLSLTPPVEVLVVGMEVIGADQVVEVESRRLQRWHPAGVGSGQRELQAAFVERLPHGGQPGFKREQSIGRLLPPRPVAGRLVIDAQPPNAGVALLFDQMLRQRGQSIRKILHRQRTAMHAADRILTPLEEGVPFHVAPHLLQEHVRMVALAPVEDAVEDPHFRIVPTELPTLWFVNPLLEFHAVPVQAQPARVVVDLGPRRVILSRRIPAPAAAAVALARKDRMRLLRHRDRFLDRVPRRADAAAHGVSHGRHIHADADLLGDRDGRCLCAGLTARDANGDGKNEQSPHGVPFLLACI